ncbi:MAG: type III-B CRISPR-associated protein Cas10/Cmr2 [Rhizonema sp. NSF051]|nr:type III-B CRISPR-associated protein Cas10/Cmr2 [Rhizonema sp. NSF051]
MEWEPGAVESWVSKFKQFLHDNPHRYYENTRSLGIEPQKVDEAKSVREIANASNPEGFVAYIYADGNNMGGYIQKIKTPEEYKQFSEDIFKATEGSVYEALAQYLKPHKLKHLTDPDNKHRNGTWIHPFEIITIGGDDVMLIVPADKALVIANTIGIEFEKQLLKPEKQRRYSTQETYNPQLIHRYQSSNRPSGSNQSKLSLSIGVLITAEDTPIEQYLMYHE